MIDSKVRKSLSQDVRRLITGRMTNDAFDDVYNELYEPSDDRAVREVAAFCYGLYSSDVLPYRLRGWHAVDEETRIAAVRCVLLLRSRLEYEWPAAPDSPGIRLLAGLAMFLGIPAGIALLLVCGAVAASGSIEMTAHLAVLGLLVLSISTAVTFWWPRLLAEDWKSFQQLGDYDVWPFIRTGDFENARATCHMFGR